MARSKRLPGERRYWTLVASPTKGYRVDEAVRESSGALWRTRGSDLRTGDRVLIWRSQGRDKKRGVVALGEVTADPVMMHERQACNEYWTVTPSEAENTFTDVRYVKPLDPPLWLDGPHRRVLEALSNAKPGPAGTVFKVTPEQWEAVVEAAGGWPEDDPIAIDPLVSDVDAYVEEVAGKAGRRGQGFRVSAQARRAFELHAMQMAVAQFAAEGWHVRDVSASESYDLHCTRPDELDLRVEVKGTSSDGSTVLLTPNEVRHARQHYPNVALYVANSIRVDESGGNAVAAGGDARVYAPWDVDAGELEPVGFTHRPAPT